MKVRIIMEITGDDGEEIGREIIADMTKITTGAEDLGLSLAERRPSTAHCTRPSRRGIRAWQTIITETLATERRRNCHTIPHALLIQLGVSLSTLYAYVDSKGRPRPRAADLLKKRSGTAK